MRGLYRIDATCEPAREHEINLNVGILPSERQREFRRGTMKRLVLLKAASAAERGCPRTQGVLPRVETGGENTLMNDGEIRGDVGLMGGN